MAVFGVLDCRILGDLLALGGGEVVGRIWIPGKRHVTQEAHGRFVGRLFQDSGHDIGIDDIILIGFLTYAAVRMSLVLLRTMSEPVPVGWVRTRHRLLDFAELTCHGLSRSTA